MSTLISNLYNLYKMQTTGHDEDAKEYSKHLPIDQAKDLRIGSNFVISAIAFFARRYMAKQTPNAGAKMPDALYQEAFTLLTQQEYLDLAYDSIIDIPINWNVLDMIDGDKGGDIFIAVDYHIDNKHYGDLEDSLQWQCYLAASIYRLLPIYNKPELQSVYDGLVNGIARCFVDGDIKRHPLKSIAYDLETISTDMIGGLAIFCAVTKDSRITKLVADTFEKSDYFIPNTSVDMSPCLIWNQIRAMSYAFIRMTQGKLNSDDKSKVLDMMSIMPYDANPPQSRSIYGAVTACNLAEAIAIMDSDFAVPAIEFVKYQYESSNEMNPEFSSILANLYHLIGYKTDMENMIDITLRWSSQFKGLDRKKNLVLDGYDGTYPLPVKYRSSNDYYWQRTAYSTALDTSRDHPNVDLLSILSRALPLSYYPS